MRREKLEHLITTGKLEGKRSRGRQRKKITDGLATWLGPGRVTETLTAVKDRDLWRDMSGQQFEVASITIQVKKKTTKKNKKQMTIFSNIRENKVCPFFFPEREGRGIRKIQTWAQGPLTLRGSMLI
ncbi:hypothetical protein PoB_004388000 [Plakobranchus ocellatus]|uniref:Uncharacterized protein n=1 Tax=Plakobranchus ocellatus TaxID=259542 RepID=A0AAV4BCX8_9GAST|nr:hypothetical protein PoB_004388000 [Plakobranchus ocellatus]